MNVNDYTKSSNLNLYNVNDLSEKSLFIDCNNDGTKIEIKEKLDIDVPILSLSNQVLDEYNLDDVGKFLYDEKQHKNTNITRIDGLIANNTQNLNNETINRLSQGVTLQANLDSEVQRATTKENEISTNLDTKINQVNLNISNETQSRILADTTNYNSLYQKIQDEKTSRVSDVSNINTRIDNILEGSDIDLDNLREITDYFKNADTDIIESINLLMTRLVFVENKLSLLTGGGI